RRGRCPTNGGSVNRSSPRRRLLGRHASRSTRVRMRRGNSEIGSSTGKPRRNGSARAFRMGTRRNWRDGCCCAADSFARRQRTSPTLVPLGGRGHRKNRPTACKKKITSSSKNGPLSARHWRPDSRQSFCERVAFRKAALVFASSIV